MSKKSENNKNLLYFEAPSMKSLFESMQNWQKENQKRFLSMSIQKEGKKFCCIALTNPSEVIICGGGGSSEKAVVSHGGYLNVKTY